MPPETSHISVVQTPVKASGKKSRTVFRLPKLSLSLTSSRPLAVLVLRVKSGAVVPVLRGIGEEGKRKNVKGKGRSDAGKRRWFFSLFPFTFTLLLLGCGGGFEALGGAFFHRNLAAEL